MEGPVMEVFPAVRNQMALTSAMSSFQKKTKLVMVSARIPKKKLASYIVVQCVLVETGWGEDGWQSKRCHKEGSMEQDQKV